jgi:hypothetical protein
MHEPRRMMDRMPVECRSVLALAAILFCTACAQKRVATTFRELDPAVRPGTGIRITTADGRQMTGTVESLSAANMRVRSGEGTLREFAEADVSRIVASDPLWDGVLIGAAAAALPVALIADEGCTAPQAAPDCKQMSRGTSLAMLAAIGAGVGLGVDLLRRDDVFRTPAPPAASLRLVPVAGPGVAGFVLSARF